MFFSTYLHYVRSKGKHPVNDNTSRIFHLFGFILGSVVVIVVAAGVVVVVAVVLLFDGRRLRLAGGRLLLGALHLAELGSPVLEPHLSGTNRKGGSVIVAYENI